MKLILNFFFFSFLSFSHRSLSKKAEMHWLTLPSFSLKAFISCCASSGITVWCKEKAGLSFFSLPSEKTPESRRQNVWEEEGPSLVCPSMLVYALLAGELWTHYFICLLKATSYEMPWATNYNMSSASSYEMSRGTSFLVEPKECWENAMKHQAPW